MTTSASVTGRFYRFVVPNMFAMLAISAYFLADTYFISAAVGPDGLTALNLVLPVYSLIMGLALMVAVGGATRFRILISTGNKDGASYFGNAIFYTFLLSIPFLIVGLFFSEEMVVLLGADENIVALASEYSSIFMLFAPFFMWNHVCNCFSRNDGAPNTAMVATIVSSLFNIVFDYILMYPLGMGMAGAAWATALSPIVAILINLTHLLSKKSSISLRQTSLSFRQCLSACQLGVAALIGELALGITTLVFNFIILGLSGNIGVAAYGVIANIAYTANAIYNGLSQGAQPLFSQYFGEESWPKLSQSLRLTITTGFIIAVVMVALTNFFADPIVAIFNSHHDEQMQVLAVHGIRLYFTGYLVACVNIAATSYLAATTAASWATATSFMRGAGATIPCAFMLAALWGMTGVWLTFAAAEAVTLLLVLVALHRANKQYRAMMGA